MKATTTITHQAVVFREPRRLHDAGGKKLLSFLEFSVTKQLLVPVYHFNNTSPCLRAPL